MSFSAPRPLDASHHLEGFDCGKPALTDWLLRYARQAHGSGSARTFISCDGERIAGYYSLTVGQIRYFRGTRAGASWYGAVPDPAGDSGQAGG